MTATPQDPLRRLVQAVKDYDKKLNAREVAPTGDDYNQLYTLVRDLANDLMPRPAPPCEAPGTPTVYECPNGDWTGTMDQLDGLDQMADIGERLEPGELVPAGCCPVCNARIEVEDRDVPHYTLFEVGLIMRQRGWAVAAPADCPSLNPTQGA